MSCRPMLEMWWTNESTGWQNRLSDIRYTVYRLLLIVHYGGMVVEMVDGGGDG